MTTTTTQNRIVIHFTNGTCSYLCADAVGGRDQYGVLVVAMRGTKTKRKAWNGSPSEKDEIISQIHQKMAIGYCRQVSYLC